MSIRVMSQVWDNGPARKSDLLMLLAIADRADDEGKAWPAVPTLADKCRVDRRAAQRTIRRLEDEGWLSIESGGGRRSNTYCVNLERLTSGAVTSTAGVVGTAAVTSTAPGAVVMAGGAVTSTASAASPVPPDSSWTRHEDIIEPTAPDLSSSHSFSLTTGSETTSEASPSITDPKVLSLMEVARAHGEEERQQAADAADRQARRDRRDACAERAEAARGSYDLADFLTGPTPKFTTPEPQPVATADMGQTMDEYMAERERRNAITL